MCAAMLGASACPNPPGTFFLGHCNMPICGLDEAPVSGWCLKPASTRLQLQIPNTGRCLVRPAGYRFEAGFTEASGRDVIVIFEAVAP